MKLNESGLRIGARLLEHSLEYKTAVQSDVGGARIVDCGVRATGSLAAGRVLAEVCMAGLGRVEIGAGDVDVWPGPWVSVTTDHPVAACMASQYAGWPISGSEFFAMGSGPLRAARGREPLFEKIGCRESPREVIGVLECGKLPPKEILREMANECGTDTAGLTVLVAPTASIAGTVQVVARSVETALHKMSELDFDVKQVVAGWGTAPLPPVAADDLTGIGRTNDAVLYGARVTLWLRAEDDQLRALGPRIPSCGAADHGCPFIEIFERYDRDFYKIDPMLFSPARIQLFNLDTGHAFCFGEVRADVIRKSFLNES